VETNTGFVCGEAENGSEGIEKAKELQPDLILLNLTLPGISGLKLDPSQVAAAPREDNPIHGAYGWRQSGVGFDIWHWPCDFKIGQHPHTERTPDCAACVS
jgi:hypothetical protein